MPWYQVDTVERVDPDCEVGNARAYFAPYGCMAAEQLDSLPLPSVSCRDLAWLGVAGYV
jgi:hypothetical protein